MFFGFKLLSCSIFASKDAPSAWILCLERSWHWLQCPGTVHWKKHILPDQKTVNNFSSWELWSLLRLWIFHAMLPLSAGELMDPWPFSAPWWAGLAWGERLLQPLQLKGSHRCFILLAQTKRTGQAKLVSRKEINNLLRTRNECFHLWKGIPPACKPTSHSLCSALYKTPHPSLGLGLY